MCCGYLVFFHIIGFVALCVYQIKGSLNGFLSELGLSHYVACRLIQYVVCNLLGLSQCVNCGL